jgi:hypothetical protein
MLIEISMLHCYQFHRQFLRLFCIHDPLDKDLAYQTLKIGPRFPPRPNTTRQQKRYKSCKNEEEIQIKSCLLHLHELKTIPPHPARNHPTSSPSPSNTTAPCPTPSLSPSLPWSTATRLNTSCHSPDQLFRLCRCRLLRRRRLMLNLRLRLRSREEEKMRNTRPDHDEQRLHDIVEDRRVGRLGWVCLEELRGLGIGKAPRRLRGRLRSAVLADYGWRLG